LRTGGSFGLASKSFGTLVSSAFAGVTVAVDSTPGAAMLTPSSIFLDAVDSA